MRKKPHPEALGQQVPHTVRASIECVFVLEANQLLCHLRRPLWQSCARCRRLQCALPLLRVRESTASYFCELAQGGLARCSRHAKEESSQHRPQPVNYHMEVRNMQVCQVCQVWLGTFAEAPLHFRAAARHLTAPEDDAIEAATEGHVSMHSSSCETKHGVRSQVITTSFTVQNVTP